MQSIDKTQITGLILAGGRATRMGGLDKGLVLFNGRPLIEYVLDVLRPQCSEVLLSVNRNEDRYASYGHRLVADADRSFPGPLAGIASALQAMRTSYLAVAPCDSPYLPADYVSRLAQALQENPQAKAAAARTNGREQSVFMMLKKEALIDVRLALAQGRLAVHRWLNETMHAVWVDFEDEAAFENLNRPEDLVAHGKE